jgi:biotin transport system substrate-specific component
MTATAFASDRMVLADLLPGERVRDVVLVLTGAGLTGLAAQISVHTPLSPVPFTLQTLAVLLVGGALGPLRGALSMLVYLLAGVVGLPWYANHSHGWGGPSFGYIIGFVLAAAAVGALAKRGQDRDPVSTIGLMVLGSAIVYLVGTIWLSVDLGLSASKAIAVGVTPFLITDALKVAVAAVALPTAWRIVRR